MQLNDLSVRGHKMLSFEENGWLYPDPLNNITHDIDSAKIKDLSKLAEKEDYWSASVRETVQKLICCNLMHESQ